MHGDVMGKRVGHFASKEASHFIWKPQQQQQQHWEELSKGGRFLIIS